MSHMCRKEKFKAVCVHIGRNTVADAELDPSQHEIVKAAREIAKNYVSISTKTDKSIFSINNDLVAISAPQ